MPAFDSFSKDLRYSLRQLKRNKMFTVIAVLTLALGVGANTAIFSVIYSVFLKSLPYPDSKALVFAVWKGRSELVPNVTASNFLFWRDQNRAFQSMGIYEPASGANLSVGIHPYYVRVTAISDGLLATFRIPPILGREFTAEEVKPGGPHVAILSDELWQRAFADSPEVIGANIHVNGQQYTVVGVLPRDFDFVAAADMYLPLQIAISPKDEEQNYNLVARLKDGVSLAAAQSDSARVFQAYTTAYPASATDGWKGLEWTSYDKQLTSTARLPLVLMFAAVLLVLFIAIANVANLFFGQMISRRSEMGVRVALGSSSPQILRQLLTESLMVTIAGGAAGVLISYLGLRYLVALIPRMKSIDLNTSLLPLNTQITLNGPVLLYSVLIVLAAGCAIAIVCWFQLRRMDPAEWLKNRRAGSVPHHRARSTLVVVQVVFSMVLLFGAGLLLASFLALRSVSLGFDPHRVWVLEMSMPAEQYKTTADAWIFENKITERLRLLPGVMTVASSSNLPVERGLNFPFEIKGCGRFDNMQIRAVSADYFNVLQIPMLQGRAFFESDGQTPLVIINEVLARRCWSKREPVGSNIAKLQIVGVAGNTREQGLDKADLPIMYLPHWQVPDFFTRMVHNWFLAVWVLRTNTDLDNQVVQRAIAAADPTQPIATLRPMTQVITESNAMARNKFLESLLALFALLAVALAAIGIFGITSHAVLYRTHEIGIRMALGAQKSQVLRLMIWHGLRLAVIGVALGLIAAFESARYLQSVLFAIRPTNPILLFLTGLLFLLVALVASYLPAQRATGVDPNIALQNE